MTTHLKLLVLNLVYSVQMLNGHDSNAQDNKKSLNVVHGRYTRDLKSDYYFVIPRRVKQDGTFHSYELPQRFDENLRKKRSVTDDDQIHYSLHFNNVTHHLELEPNVRLTAPGMLIEKRSGGANLSSNVLSQPTKHLCHFTGRVRGHRVSRAAVSVCDGLVGYLITDHGQYFVEPVEGSAAKETGEHVHVVYKRSLDEHMLTDSHSCSVTGLDNWWDSLSYAMKEIANKHTKHLQQKRSDAGASLPRYIEILCVADLKFIQHHRNSDIEEYILATMNVASDLYHDVTVGNMIELVVVRIIYLEKQEDEMDLEINTKAESTLASFCNWQIAINPKDHNHPNHHDLALLFTRYDLCSNVADGCGLVGLAYVGTVCTTDRNCAITEDIGLVLGIVVAHEFGHNLGCAHDSPSESGCEDKVDETYYSVMTPRAVANTKSWSTCSRAFITNLLEDQLGECLLDEPKDHSYHLHEMPIGTIYDADEQCKLEFGDTFINRPVKGDKVCQQLWCKEPSTNKCFSKRAPLADGTRCGVNKWCYERQCVAVGERPSAVNGEWSPWGEWGQCSRTCGGGISVRERLCNNPQPANFGRYCLGKRKEYRMCNTENCDEDAVKFRDVQCAEFNSKQFQGVYHEWKSFEKPDSEPNPCVLYCINEANVFTKMAPRVKDGTRCKPGTRDTCVQGVCMRVGCDWVLNSKTIEDICGICGGSGINCNVTKGRFDAAGTPGYVDFLTVPEKSVKIQVEEVMPSENMIAVSAADKKTYFLNGDYREQRPGDYKFGGVKGFYIKHEPQREAIYIKGPTKEVLIFQNVRLPITEPVVVRINQQVMLGLASGVAILRSLSCTCLFVESVCFFNDKNPGIKYSYSVPTDKPMYTPKYHWEFVQWEECTARCGGGIQVAESECIEERDGKVSANFCSTLEAPDMPKTRLCNQQPCRSRWKVWKWGPCSGCIFRSGVRKRKVECVKENPSGTGDDEIITDPKECGGIQPPSIQLCNSSKRCPKDQKLKRSSGGESFCDNPTSNKLNISFGDIAVDPVPDDLMQLEMVEVQNQELDNMTDNDFVELGGEVPVQLEVGKSQEYFGDEVVKKLKEIKYGPSQENDTIKHPRPNSTATTAGHVSAPACAQGFECTAHLQ